MGKVLDDAIETFNILRDIPTPHGEFIATIIPELVQTICELPEGTDFGFAEYITEKYGDEKIGLIYGQTVPYLTGPFGPLDLVFETRDGRPVIIGRDGIIDATDSNRLVCLTTDGEEHDHKDVLVIFRRNDRT